MACVRAWTLDLPRPVQERPLVLRDLKEPEPGPGEISVRVECCGVCRTDLHVVEGEISLPVLPIVPGHQVVGRVAKLGRGAGRFRAGERVGVAWLGRTCGACADCLRGDENLCRASVYTGYHRNGGFAEMVVADEAFAYRLPEEGPPAVWAPLLCAGIIGYRALRQAGLGRGETVGLYGFGSSAHIALQVARHFGNRVFVVTRGEKHRALARRMGADWVGDVSDALPAPMDRAVVFAPAGELLAHALERVRWGGAVASACIHMSPIPAMDYARHLFGERTLRSTTANTRRDGEELLALAAAAGIRPETTLFPFSQANEALLALRSDSIAGSGVIMADRPAGPAPQAPR